LRERRLVESAGTGDRSAFTELYARHRDLVYGLALRLTGERDLAEEVLLESFAAAWVNLPRFRGDSGFGTWVCGIAVNRARDATRTRTRRRSRVVAVDPARFGAGVAAWTDGARHAETRIDLERAIAGLPPGAREALVLRHVHGFSCAEAAAIMGVTEGTVKSQTSRACALLRETLEHD